MNLSIEEIKEIQKFVTDLIKDDLLEPHEYDLVYNYVYSALISYAIAKKKET